MKILITGADGFVGKNLSHALRNIMDGKDRTHPEISVDELYLYDVSSPAEILDTAAKNADFVFNLAGINRPQNPEEFISGNVDFLETLLGLLKKHNNKCPVMLSSSVQATLIGRYDSDYGRSKRAAEDKLFEYSKETDAKVLIYRFPNLFGKWCRPNYNSVIATFCNNIANDLPISVNDPDTTLELLYIDDLVDEMISALAGNEHRAKYYGLTPIANANGRFCFVPLTYRATLGEISSLLYTYRGQAESLIIPEIPDGSFAKKLYSTYLSYLPADKIAFSLSMNTDERGSFTELLKTEKCGQFSVNISRPGVTKGQHWHNSKWEFFMVVSGTGLIRMRRLDSEEVIEFKVSGEEIKAVHMLPGYTHSIVNLSDTNDLVTVMWANECFDKNKPDTFFEVV